MFKVDLGAAPALNCGLIEPTSSPLWTWNRGHLYRSDNPRGHEVFAPWSSTWGNESTFYKTVCRVFERLGVSWIMVTACMSTRSLTWYKLVTCKISWLVISSEGGHTAGFNAGKASSWNMFTEPHKRSTGKATTTGKEKQAKLAQIFAKNYIFKTPIWKKKQTNKKNTYLEKEQHYWN